MVEVNEKLLEELKLSEEKQLAFIQAGQRAARAEASERKWRGFMGTGRWQKLLQAVGFGNYGFTDDGSLKLLDLHLWFSAGGEEVTVSGPDAYSCRLVQTPLEKQQFIVALYERLVERAHAIEMQRSVVG